MKPICTPRSTTVYKLVGGTPDNDLPVEQAITHDGKDVLVSTWELTDEERRLISIGRPVTLTVWGIGTPPVALTVEA